MRCAERRLPAVSKRPPARVFLIETRVTIQTAANGRGARTTACASMSLPARLHLLTRMPVSVSGRAVSGCACCSNMGVGLHHRNNHDGSYTRVNSKTEHDRSVTLQVPSTAPSSSQFLPVPPPISAISDHRTVLGCDQCCQSNSMIGKTECLDPNKRL